MISHLNYLHEKIFELKQLEINNLSEPTLFEYYSAVFLTNHYNQPFYIWKDLSPSQKQNFNLPCRDKGVDISNCSFTILGQSKYYSKNSTVTYGKLSTFLAFDKLNPTIKNIDFCLLRLTESNISSEVSQMISYKTLKDFPIEKDIFMSYINSIPPPVYPDKIIVETQFRYYQQEAENTIISSRLNNKNCIISIPTGGGKTHVTIQYCKKTTGCFVILVPTIILMNQWADEAFKEGITSNSIYKIGTGNNKTISAKNINKYKLVICVYNSFIKIPKTCIDVLASIFVDEAHRIIKPNIYKEDLEELDSKDEEDESYIKEIQKSIADNNKFILLSATIDNCKGFEYFNYPIRSAINEGFLSDYQLICPIFNEDPTNINIAEYIIKKGEAHCIIYTNSIEECKRFTGVLNSLLPNCARCVHSDMNNTQVILNSYNKGEFRFLVNVRILVEGFDSCVSSSVLFLHLSSSKTFMIQSIGRVLRLHPSKKIANVYMPCSTEENTKDIRSFIKQLTEYDYKFKEAAHDKKIGTYINFEECIDEKEGNPKSVEGKGEEDEDFLQDIQHKYDIIYDSFGVDCRVNLLLEFVNENNRIPKREEIYKGIKVGNWWNSIKQGHNNNLYRQYLEQNIILKTDYERVQRLKEKNKGKDVITLDQKCNLLLEFVDKNNRTPMAKEIYKDVKLGSWWNNIKQREYTNLYKNYFDKNKILKEAYERFQQSKEENKGKDIITIEQKCNLLLEFISVENRLPTQNEIYKEVKLGIFWNGIKQGHNNNLYRQYLEQNIILKTDYERVQQLKEKNKGKEKITPDQKCNLLLEFVNEENKLPVESAIYKGVKLGKLWESVKHGQNNKIYKKYLEKNEMLKKEYERVQKNKEKKKGKEIITPDQKCNLLLEFINEENKLPTKNEIYKEVKLEKFWESIKHGYNNFYYKKYLEQNEMLKKHYERFKKRKEEKKGKEIITHEQKCNLLLEFIDQNNRTPVLKDIYKEVNLGFFWDSIKHGHNNKLYKNYLEKNEMLKKHYERCQKNKEEQKGKEKITPEQKCNLLLEFINEENRPPTQNEIYKEVKLGNFWGSIKQGKNNNVYKQFLEQNEMLKKHYERCQKNKEEKKGKEVF